MLAEMQKVKVAPQAKFRVVWDEVRRIPWLPIAILAGVLFAAVFAEWISPFDPYNMALTGRLQPPGAIVAGKVHMLGTDTLGRDLLSRIIFGARVSLLVAAAGLFVGGILGLTVGVISGYVGGKMDAVLMRLTDVFMALPALLIALVFVITLGSGLQTIVAALSIITWARFSRVIRSEVLSLKGRDFVLQAKLANCSSLRIMRKHILPNVLNTFMVLCSMQVSQCVLTEATLSFLGAGVPPPTPTWGNMVSDGRSFVSTAWWISLFPGLALTCVVFSFNTLADWLRDRLDPKLRQI